MSVTTRAIGATCLLTAALIGAACQRTDDAVAAGDGASTDTLAPVTPSRAVPGGLPASAADTAEPDPDPDPARIVKEMPAADAPTPAVAVGAQITYGCDDGNLVVTYRGPTATLVLPDGNRGTATLSVDASANAGGEVYVGDRIGLRRIGSVVELQSADAPTRRCLESGGTA